MLAALDDSLAIPPMTIPCHVPFRVVPLRARAVPRHAVLCSAVLATVAALGAPTLASAATAVTIAVTAEATTQARAPATDHAALAAAVEAAIAPVMTEHKIPGMAVAVTAGGKAYYFNYGVASLDSAQPVSENTLFELGSVSKTFTATLLAYAQQQGRLQLTDAASRHEPALAGSRFDHISLLQLATYTAGGLPLQFPDAVNSNAEVFDYFRQWQPGHAPGTQRLYSNPSIGLAGDAAARSLGQPFVTLMEATLLPQLGLAHTYIHVPTARMGAYALGYDREGRPVRVNPGPFDAQTYGVKSNAVDMIRFVQLNLDAAPLPPDWREAITATHTGYYQVGAMTQGLGWEMYPYPTALATLVAGNSPAMAFQPHAARKLEPPSRPRADMLLNKSGSTNGFGAYVACVPARRIGVVMLANRNFPLDARVAAAHRILQAIDVP